MRGLVIDLFAGSGGASPYAERFWARVEKGDGCWIWKGGRQKRGDGSLWYGVFCVGKARVLAHRFSWLLTNGPIPAGAVLRHRCDNPACVRPDHLLTGSQAQNLADMRERGRAHFNRFPSGSGHPNAKLDADKVRSIRRAHHLGQSLASIGAFFDLHASTVHDVVTGKTWRHVGAST